MVSVCFTVTISHSNFHLGPVFEKDWLPEQWMHLIVSCRQLLSVCVTSVGTSRHLVSTFSVIVSIGLTSTTLWLRRYVFLDSDNLVADIDDFWSLQSIKTETISVSWNCFFSFTCYLIEFSNSLMEQFCCSFSICANTPFAVFLHLITPLVTLWALCGVTVTGMLFSDFVAWRVFNYSSLWHSSSRNPFDKAVTLFSFPVIMLLISLANLKGLALVKDCDKSVDFAIKYLGKLCSVK